MATPVKKEIAAEDIPPDTRDLATILTVVRYAARIVLSVVKRYKYKRDHGLYTTAVEEILRTLYFEAPAFTVWKTMKKHTAATRELGIAPSQMQTWEAAPAAVRAPSR